MFERVPNTVFPCLPEDIGSNQYRILTRLCVLLPFTIVNPYPYYSDKCRDLQRPWFTLRVLQIQRERSGEGIGAIKSDDSECRFAVIQYIVFRQRPGLSARESLC